MVNLNVFQPAFGNEIKTPPNNRKPVVLLQLSACSSSMCGDSGSVLEDTDKTQCPDNSGVVSLAGLVL